MDTATPFCIRIDTTCLYRISYLSRTAPPVPHERVEFEGNRRDLDRGTSDEAVTALITAGSGTDGCSGVPSRAKSRERFPITTTPELHGCRGVGACGRGAGRVILIGLIVAVTRRQKKALSDPATALSHRFHGSQRFEDLARPRRHSKLVAAGRCMHGRHYGVQSLELLPSVRWKRPAETPAVFISTTGCPAQD
jgi:hypothetical protein